MPKRTKKPKSKLLRKEARAAYLYLIPAFIGLIVLTYIPLIAVFGLSFFKWGGTGAPEWNGINNYIKLFTTDPYFKESIKVTVYFSLLAVVGSRSPSGSERTADSKGISFFETVFRAQAHAS